ncbi:hypothetical protein EsH8_V_000602 [Colletotrichum jinshuiense]
MASAQKPQAQDVRVTLSVKHPRPEFQYPERRISLEQRNPGVINIGRTSKRFDHLEAKADNCYFDSPVMSRDHAKITVDWFHKKLFVKDVGSLHGTYHNSKRLTPHTAHELEQGDTLKFGIDIQRSNELYPPCTIEVEFEFDHLAKLAKSQAQINARPSFAVPDESDSSDNEDDMPESDVAPTIEKIRKINMHRPNQVLSRSFPGPIDLTMDSPMHEPEAQGQADTPIVIDEEIQKNPLEPVEHPANLTQPEKVREELDAPYEDEDIVPPSPKDNYDLLPNFASDSESDDSYDEDSVDYPDEQSTGQGQMNESSDEDICLSDSENEDSSEDDEDADLDNESASDSESELLEAPSYEPRDCQMDDDEYESQPDEPIPATWDVEDVVGAYQHSQHELLPAHQSYYTPANWPLAPPAPQAAMARPFRPMETQTLPSIIWPALPVSEQSEQGRPNDFRLPSILNPADSQLGHLSEASSCAQRLPLAQPSDYSAQRDKMVPRLPPWQRTSGASQLANAALEKDSWALPQNDGPSAEVLGQMTGKAEYFAAREHNKAFMRCQEDRHENLQPNDGVSETITVLVDEASASAPQSIGTADRATTSEMVNEAPKSTNVAESVWSASGEKFLNSPQAFPLSDIPDIHTNTTGEPEQLSPPMSPRSLKRKADEISTLIPQEEEEAAETAAVVGQDEEMTEDASNETKVITGQAASVGPVTPDSLDGSVPPPPKRLRSFLSKAGYFFSGGVLSVAGVVTVLAATAPAL